MNGKQMIELMMQNEELKKEIEDLKNQLQQEKIMFDAMCDLYTELEELNCSNN